MSAPGTYANPYPSIQHGWDMSAAGDTIYVLPGRYQETISGAAAKVVMGYDTTFGNRPEIYGTIISALSGAPADLNGITISTAGKYRFIDVRGYYLGYGVYAIGSSDGARIDHITVDSCLYGIGFKDDANTDSVFNCTLDGANLANSKGFYFTGSASGATVRLKNNIIVNYATGLDSTGTAFTIDNNYNDWWGNTTVGTTPGANSYFIDPRLSFALLNNYISYNYQLRFKGLSWAYEFLPSIGAYDVLGIPLISQGRTIWGRAPWGR